ncbi:MAG: NifB/NifX family molybdenum-iron cluster-binding protein [Fusobacteriaceae bacterium]
MRVCIPVEENRGENSIAYNHFGSAPFFLIYDLENSEMKVINNGDLNHAHGMCQPLKALGGEQIDVILVGGIGGGALVKLNNQGIKVYEVSNGTVLQNIELLKNKQLREFLLSNSCNQHGCSH